MTLKGIPEELRRRLIGQMLDEITKQSPGSPEYTRTMAHLESLTGAEMPSPPVPQPVTQPPRPSAPAPRIKLTRRQRAPEVVLSAETAPVYDSSPLKALAQRPRDVLEKERLEGVPLPIPGSPLELTRRYQTAKQLAARYRVSIVTIHRWLQKLPAKSYTSALIRAASRGPLSVGYKLFDPKEQPDDSPPPAGKRRK